jgi:hypothetical protein
MFAKPTWYDLRPERWDDEVREVRRRLPHAEWGERLNPKPHLFWRVNLQPYKNTDDAGLIAAHLRTLSPLDIGEDGELIPVSKVAAWDPGDLTLGRKFLVELVYAAPPQVPRVFGLYERIDSERYPDHPHLNGGEHPLRAITGFGPVNHLCTFAPHANLWSWETGTGRELLEFAALFLGSHEWWVASGRSEQNWLAPGAPHGRRVLLDTVKPTDPCPMGHGTPFGECCLPLLQKTARAA